VRWPNRLRWPRRFSGSRAFWEDNYAKGGNSGNGSYGVLADFKARVLNDFVVEHDVETVIEFGCGDGNQLSLAKYPSYIGLDISPTAVRQSIERFDDDRSKSFFLYDWAAWHDPQRVIRAELALSLDVLFHVVEDDAYHRYLSDLFDAADRWVAIYSINEDRPFPEPYSKPRKFTDWVERERPEWELYRYVPNERHYRDGFTDGTWSDFYFFRR
jgi:hypothetical protein